jgi:hypothetical protein
MCSRRESTYCFGKSLVGDIWKKKEMVNISNICWWTRQFCYLSKYYFFLKIVLNLNNWEVVESCIIQEKFEYTKGVIKSRKSKDRQYNGQQKKDKETNTDLQNITQKHKDGTTITPVKTGSELITELISHSFDLYLCSTELVWRKQDDIDVDIWMMQKKKNKASALKQKGRA